jgi:hypothetical protein
MALGLYGIGRAIQEGLPLRVALSYSGLLVVGAGSASSGPPRLALSRAPSLTVDLDSQASSSI